MDVGGACSVMLGIDDSPGGKVSETRWLGDGSVPYRAMLSFAALCLGCHLPPAHSWSHSPVGMSTVGLSVLEVAVSY